MVHDDADGSVENKTFGKNAKVNRFDRAAGAIQSDSFEHSWYKIYRLRLHGPFRLVRMKVRLHGAIVAKPLHFPDDLEMRIFPVRSSDGAQIADGSWASEERQTWEWVKRNYSVRNDAEEHIKAGENVCIFVGPVVFNPPDGTVFPEGCEYQILELFRQNSTNRHNFC